jgi:cell division inhibitor SepF
MASMWRRAMLYLGLGPDDEYDDYDLPDERQAVQGRPAAPAARYPVAGPATGQANAALGHEPEPEPGTSGAVRTLSPQPIRPQGSTPALGEVMGQPRGAVVRPLQPVASAKPYVVAPTSFNHAQDVADRFKSSTPVIVNLQNVDRDLSRRIIDFASGLCYGIGGQMERVANQVYLLTPSNVEVSAEDRRRLEERGYEG